MLKAFEYRIYPTKEQEILLSRHFGCIRFIYNYFLEVQKNHYVTTKKYMSKFEMVKQLPILKKTTMPWLSKVNAQSLCEAVYHLDLAYRNFFKKLRSFPTFKSKHGTQSFSIPQSIKVIGEKLFIPKFQEGIDTLFHRKFEGTIKSCTIKISKTRKYFVSILVEDGITTPNKLPLL